MSQGKEKEIYIIGHQNPDTDSICSAIALADLKNRMKDSDLAEDNYLTGYKAGMAENVRYIPRRAGHINQETRYVLETFGVEAPAYMSDARTQVRDIDYSRTQSVCGDISLRQAWKIMRKVSKSTLAVTESDGRLAGVITTGIIATSYMSVFDNEILGAARTSYSNILDTLEADLLIGDPEGRVTGGRVVMAAANIELMKQNIHPGDVVILGNRYEAQLCAIEQQASLLIICENVNVSRTIRRIAENAGCAVMRTPYDAYTTARMINLSMPIDYFMKKHPITFDENAFIDDIRTTMTKERFRDFPIVKEGNLYIGMISRRNLLDMEGKHLILVDHNEENQAVRGILQAEVLEIVDHHKLGTIETIRPVYVRNLPVGCTATIIYQMYLHREIPVPEKIAGLLCSAIISDTLLFRSPTCTALDRQSVAELAQIAGIDPETHARAMFDAGSDLAGKPLEEIFYMDFKKFRSGDVSFGVGQISSVNPETLAKLRDGMRDFLPQAMAKEGTDMIFFLLTDIFAESSWVIYAGEKAEAYLQDGFKKAPEAGHFLLEGVVSRKKQFVPVIMEEITA